MNYTLSGFADEIDSAISKQFDGLDALGMKWFEIRGVDGENIGDISEEKAREVKALADLRGIAVSSIGSPIGKINIKDPIEPHLEKLRHVIALAKIFKTKYIRMFSFFMPKGEDPEAYRDEVVSRLKMMAEIAEAEGVILLHENEKGIYGDTPERCRYILDAVASPNFRAVLDPANFVQCGCVPCPDAYEMLKDKIEYIHIKDAVGEKVVPPGEGDGTIRELLTALSRDGYEGFISLEPHLAQFDGLAGLEEEGNTSAVNEEKAGLHTFKIAFDAFNRIVEKI